MFSFEDLKKAKIDLVLMTVDYPEVLGVEIGNNKIICYLSRDTIIPDSIITDRKSRKRIPISKVILNLVDNQISV